MFPSDCLKMATTLPPGIKFDDGSGGFASSCFPVRGLVRFGEEESGAWMVAQKAEQRRRFKAVLCTKPRDFDSIRAERKRSEKEGTAIIPPIDYGEENDDEIKLLDGFFLMKHCCVEDPADLCSVNISGQGFSDVKEEDFQLFDNVAYVNAAENFLPLECFRSFPILRELEMPLNGYRGIKTELGDFLTLELLDLSYNNLSPADVLPLGLLPSLRVLHLTGNSLPTLLPDMAHPHVEQLRHGSRKIQRFVNLEILLLDDNKLSDLTAFAALAGLRKLKHLNLAKNEIFSVPQLMLVEGRHVTQEFDDFQGRGKTPKSGRKSSRSRRSRTSARKSATKSAKSRNGGENSTAGQKVEQTEQQPRDKIPSVFPMDTSINGQSTGEFLKEIQHLVRTDGESRKTDYSTVPGTTANNTYVSEKDMSNLTADVTTRDTSSISGTKPRQQDGGETSHISDSISQSQKDTSNLTKNEDGGGGATKPDVNTEGGVGGDIDDGGSLVEGGPMVAEGELNATDSLLDLDDMLEELNLDKIDEQVEKEIVHEKEVAAEEKEKEDMMDRMGSSYQEYDDSDMPLPPPFPELRYLNLSHNQIEEEEGLLAVAAWPMLSELIIHDNPLTTEHSGDPPLLKRFLHDRLGIHIERLKPDPLPKPHIRVEPNPTRKVKTLIPPVPRCDVDALLALEYNTAPTEESQSVSSSRSSSSKGGFEGSQPLPPIQQTTLDEEFIIEEEDEDDYYDEDDEADPDSVYQPHPPSAPKPTNQDDAFFMTAVDDQPEEPPICASSEKGTKKKKKKEKAKPVDRRYRGYEELLEIDETVGKDDVPTPKDISGNIRALQYTLNHPLVFRENRVYLDRPQKPYQPYKRGVKETKPKKPRTYVVEEAITFLKERRTTEEESLKDVLNNPRKYTRHFSEAPDLLQAVQHKYNRVRAKSVKNAREVQQIIQNTLQDVDEKAHRSQLISSS